MLEFLLNNPSVIHTVAINGAPMIHRIETATESAQRFESERRVWGPHSHFYGDTFRTKCRQCDDDENVIESFFYRSFAPVRPLHWRIILGQYIKGRPNFNAYDALTYGSLYKVCPLKYAASPIIAPVLIEYLNEHPARRARWNWVLENSDEMWHVQINEHCWA
jgi:hypothetical protein